jgi:hypothetical protein
MVHGTNKDDILIIVKNEWVKRGNMSREKNVTKKDHMVLKWGGGA